ncbi:MAG: exodeoxyribonuclease VII large subunit, partial [Lentisphaerae bacterium]|nr:exodeoxyribonuclease VII large subunit [Lentisphaerota bacterium]
MHPEDTNQDMPSVWTVSELNRIVRDVLEQSLSPLWLRGEISNLTIHRSGHVYFTLKDAHSQVSAVFFRGSTEARELGLKVGLEIEVQGRISVYEPRGTYQVIVSKVRTKGLGQLQKLFDELKRRLREEGLFDEERKRPVPVLPRCVGVVTSPDGAAIRDFMQILTRRFTNMHIRIVPAAVQGSASAAEIAA